MLSCGGNQQEKCYDIDIKLDKVTCLQKEAKPWQRILIFFWIFSCFHAFLIDLSWRWGMETYAALYKTVNRLTHALWERPYRRWPLWAARCLSLGPLPPACCLLEWTNPSASILCTNKETKLWWTPNNCSSLTIFSDIWRTYPFVLPSALPSVLSPGIFCPKSLTAMDISRPQWFL